MKYSEVLKYFEKNKICPFCKKAEQHIIYENKYMYVVAARSPYTKDHLLIIPQRHVILIQELNKTELSALYKLITIRTDKLHSKHKSINLLLRDGFANLETGKSINHLHFHLIPDLPIGIKKGSGKNREFLDDNDYKTISETIKQTYN